ncbi:MAG TPA: glycosyltransferase family 39 protein [Bryobacteraceae bacterium]|nr:glycosyltransferase family 39 protein [Bryobacteraceae bacterium]
MNRWLLALCLVRLWVMPMRSSFWVDEMATVFVVQQGAGHPSLAVAPQVAKSVYYWLPRVSGRLFGFSEIACRLPSLLAMALALWLVARLAARLIHPRAAWFAVFACLALRGFDYQAADARPYGLGTLLACAGLYCLVRWLDSARWRDAILFLLFGALVWRVQLVFWPLYLVFALYALARLARRDTQVAWTGAGLVFVVLGATLAPVLPDAASLYRQAGAHVVAALPSARDVADSLKLGLVAVCGAGAWLLARVFRWQPDAAPLSRAALVLILGWWLCQPLGLFAFSWLTGASLFVSRYLWLSLPGGVLAAVALASRWIPAKHWTAAAAAMAAGVLLLNGAWSRLWPLHHNSDWRSAVHAIRELGPLDGTPVICPSPFIEAKPPVWHPDYPLPGFLYAHLYVYPVPGKVYLFPFESSPQAEEYASRLARDVLPAARRFVIYGGAGQAGYWREWFEKRPELAGWHVSRPGPFADVDVFVFER